MFLSSLMIFKILKQIEGCWLLTQLLKCRISVHFCDAQCVRWGCCSPVPHIFTSGQHESKGAGRWLTLVSGGCHLACTPLGLLPWWWRRCSGTLARWHWWKQDVWRQLNKCVPGGGFTFMFWNSFQGLVLIKKIFKNGCSRNSGSSKCQEWSVHLTACIDKG